MKTYRLKLPPFFLLAFTFVFIFAFGFHSFREGKSKVDISHISTDHIYNINVLAGKRSLATFGRFEAPQHRAGENTEDERKATARIEEKRYINNY